MQVQRCARGLKKLKVDGYTVSLEVRAYQEDETEVLKAGKLVHVYEAHLCGK